MKSHLAELLSRFKRELITIGLFSAVINILMLSPTLYMLQVFDRVMISQSEITLIVLTALVLSFYCVQAFCEWMRSRLMIGVGLHLDAALSAAVFHGTFRDQLRMSGRAPIQSFSDMTTIRQWLTGNGAFAFFDLPWSPIYLGVMFMLHPMLGWLTILFMLILLGFAWWTSVATQASNEASEDEEKTLNVFIHSKLQNAEVIEAHGMVPNFMKHWWQQQISTLQAQTNGKSKANAFTVSSKELRVLMQSLSLGAAALLAFQGELSFGAMIAASLLVGRATSPIDQIVGGWSGFIAARQAMRRLESVLQQAPNAGQLALPTPDQISVALRAVSATAEGREARILTDIHANFPAGRVYIVRGSSGAGKSTLGKLILGIWPDWQGEVLLNGCPIQSLDRSRLGAHLGYLPQDIELFSGTVADNIARMNAPDSAKVIEAAQIAGAHDMILRLPNGYDSKIGPGGHTLSGGQRQQVALARAVYGLPRLIVLDEPNSNLDVRGEAALIGALKRLREQRCTVLMITHRALGAGIADEVLQMEAGRIVRRDAESTADPIADELPTVAPLTPAMPS